MLAKRNVIMYHITATSRVSTILRSGLRPTKREDAPIDVPAIYLAASPGVAALWAIDFIEDLQEAAFEEPMTILAVRVRAGTEVYEDPEGYGEAFYIIESIPPKDLRVVERNWTEKLPPETSRQSDRRFEELRTTLEGFPKRYEE